MNLRNLTLGAFVAITAAFPIIARADCAYSTKYNLNMALGFLKDFAAYEREGGAVNDELAAAALNNLRHELDFTDWNDVFECGHRAVSFYEALDVHASLGEARAEAHTAAGEDDPDNAKLDLSTFKCTSSMRWRTSAGLRLWIPELQLTGLPMVEAAS